MRRYAYTRPLLAMALLAPMLGARTGLAAQAKPRSVQVVVLEHFAAFDPDSARPPEAKSFEAVVLRRAPWGDGGSIIVLSPAAVTPETLGGAIRALSAPAGPNLIVVSAAAGARLPPSARAALEAQLEELTSQRPAYIPKLGRGRSITIVDPLALVLPEG